MKNFTFALFLSMMVFVGTSCDNTNMTNNLTPNNARIEASATPSSSVNMVMMTSVYTTCAETLSTQGSRGQTMSGTMTPVTNGVVYKFDGTSTVTGHECEMHFKVRDMNGGSIMNGDTLRMTQVDYKICGTPYTLQLHNLPVTTINSDTVRINFGDCIVPLNGTSGQISVTFIQ